MKSSPPAFSCGKTLEDPLLALLDSCGSLFITNVGFKIYLIIYLFNEIGGESFYNTLPW